MIHDMNFKFIEKPHSGLRLMSYTKVRNNEVIHYLRNVPSEFVEFHIKESNEKIIHIFEYFEIKIRSNVCFKRVNAGTEMFITNQFPKEVLICNVGSICGIWYSDICSDELKTMIELMGN